MSTDTERERASEQQRGRGDGGRERDRERECDSPLFSCVLLMATNLIICLHSGAAETCYLTYTLALAHSPLLLTLILSLSPLPHSPAQALLLSNPRGEGLGQLM